MGPGGGEEQEGGERGNGREGEKGDEGGGWEEGSFGGTGRSMQGATSCLDQHGVLVWGSGGASPRKVTTVMPHRGRWEWNAFLTSAWPWALIRASSQLSGKPHG